MKLLTFVFIFLFSSLSIPLLAKEQSPKEIYQDIKLSLGIVPQFLKEFPQSSLEGAWQEFKSVQLAQNLLTPKQKQLIGLGVSSQIPCHYCIYFHKKMAKFSGATREEINEAIAVASNTRKWSAYLTGIQTDLKEFEAELDKIIAFVSNANTQEGAGPPVVNLTDAQSVYQDVQNQFGFVPKFIKEYPDFAIVGAWKHFKVTEMTPTALDTKTKSLIGLAVAAQTPCFYCTSAGIKISALNGASTLEAKEAVLVSSQTRHWSTFINGIEMNKKKFKKEVKQILYYLKNNMNVSQASTK